MGKPLFSCNRANFAWGAIAYGHVLDDRGQIWFYDLGKTWSPQPAGDGLYLRAGLTERFRNPVLESRRVRRAKLAAMLKKAELARSGRLEERQVSHDAGGSGCEAYLWERADAYQVVELGTDGDISIKNTAPEAGELKQWLQVELRMGERGQPPTRIRTPRIP